MRSGVRTISWVKWRGLQFLRRRKRTPRHLERRITAPTYHTTWERIEGIHTFEQLCAWVHREHPNGRLVPYINSKHSWKLVREPTLEPTFEFRFVFV